MLLGLIYSPGLLSGMVPAVNSTAQTEAQINVLVFLVTPIIRPGCRENKLLCNLRVSLEHWR